MTGARLALSLKPVEVFKWDVGSWENCSSSCGGGLRKRQVACREVDSVTGQLAGPAVDNDKCEEPPVSEEPCNLRACPPANHKEAASSKPKKDKARPSRHLSGWAVTMLVVVSMGALAGLSFAAYTYYQRRHNSDSGFVYVMLEGYN